MFRRVSHRVIRWNLERIGVPSTFIDLIEDLYDGVTFTVDGEDGDTRPIRFGRGLKPSCPLSLTLIALLTADIGHVISAKYGVGRDDIYLLLNCMVLRFRPGVDIGAVCNAFVEFAEFANVEVSKREWVSVGGVPETSNKRRPQFITFLKAQGRDPAPWLSEYE